MTEKLFHGRPSDEVVPKEHWPEICNWDDVQEIVRELGSYIGLGLRSDLNWIRYKRYLRLLEALGISREGPICKQLDGREVAVLDNKFDYDRLVERANQALEPEGLYVEHVCVWRSGEGSGLSEEEIGALLFEKYGKTLVDWCGHVHTYEYRSINGLWHVHVFVLRENINSFPVIFC